MFLEDLTRMPGLRSTKRSKLSEIQKDKKVMDFQAKGIPSEA